MIKDLSAAFAESIFQKGFLLNKNGFTIYLYDVTCSSFENSAAIRYQVSDTIYHLKLNRFNSRATDDALAATLIHEIMHCVLLDIYKSAKQGDDKALASIAGFGLNRNHNSGFLNNDFFVLMDSDESKQHELIYQLYYPRMVSLLERFEEIHKEVFFDHDNAEFLMWSGSQNTSSYKRLGDEEKREIELTILQAKGINIEKF
ncbi:MAG: hypothetical protein ACHQF0_03600 [Chitinophagales bacterium]